jgi:hypothetical protein
LITLQNIFINTSTTSAAVLSHDRAIRTTLHKQLQDGTQHACHAVCTQVEATCLARLYFEVIFVTAAAPHQTCSTFLLLDFLPEGGPSLTGIAVHDRQQLA